MKGINFGGIAKLLDLGLSKMNRNLPSILTGCAVIGVAVTAWATYKAAPDVKSAIEGAKWNKANKSIEDEDKPTDDATDTDDVELNAWETVTAVAPYVWKPVVCGAATVSCILGANFINIQRLGVLTVAYKVSEGKLKEYKTKVEELLGKEKTEEVEKAIAVEAIGNALSNSSVVQTPYKGVIAYDPWSGRLFTSNEATLRGAEAFVNRLMTCGDFVTLNDFYDELGLERTKAGDGFGWGFSVDSTPLYLEFDYIPMNVDGETKAVWSMRYTPHCDPSCF